MIIRQNLLQKREVHIRHTKPLKKELLAKQQKPAHEQTTSAKIANLSANNSTIIDCNELIEEKE